MKKSFICINCPRGCRLNVVGENGQFTVSGNQCLRGKTYAVQEVTDPRRMVTAAVPSALPDVPCAAVRTSAPLPLALIPLLLNELYAMALDKPARRGDILLPNWNSTGIDIIFTADFGGVRR